MRKLTSLLALCFLVSATALWAGEPDEASAKSETAESMLKKEKTSTSDDDSYKKFRFGGYGEMVAFGASHLAFTKSYPTVRWQRV